MVGASGAISGVLGFYFVWFPRNVVRVLLLFFPILVRVVEVPARIVLGIYLFIDNLAAVAARSGGGGGGGVAHGAHIGGFVAGVAAAWVMARRDVAATPQEYRGAARAVAAPAAVVAQALRRGDMPMAARAYFALPAHDARRRARPGSVAGAGGVAGRARAWQGRGHRLPAVHPAHPQDPGLAEAHVGARHGAAAPLDQPALAYQHFLAALQQTRRAVAAQARAGCRRLPRCRSSPPAASPDWRRSTAPRVRGEALPHRPRRRGHGAPGRLAVERDATRFEQFGRM